MSNLGMSNLDICDLQTFVDVAESRSLSRSARALALTNAAVLQRIESLESLFAAQLFVRCGERFELTETGQALLPAARQISKELSYIEHTLASIGSDVQGHLTVAATAASIKTLPPLLQRYQSSYPDVQVSMQVMALSDLLCAVDCGDVDAAVCSVDFQPPNLHSDTLRCIPIQRYPLVVAAHYEGPLAKRSHITLADLLTYRAVMPPKTTPARRHIEHQIQQQICQPVVLQCAEPALNHKDDGTISEAELFAVMHSMSIVESAWVCLPADVIDNTNSEEPASDTDAQRLATLTVEGMSLFGTLSLVHSYKRAPSPQLTALTTLLASNSTG
jgi:DNA-binding transcriptional LysR family regulator